MATASTSTSTSRAAGLGVPSSSTSTSNGDLWSEILRSADRSHRGRGNWKRKNIVLLSERHHGRRHLLDQLLSTSNTKRKGGKSSQRGPGSELALGYEVLEVKEEGDEESAPPVSIFYPPSSQSSLLSLLPGSLPSKSLSDIAVVILLDWTRPSSMVEELVTWLDWVAEWASSTAEQGQAEELRDCLQSHLQHYAEPSSGPSATPLLNSTTYGSGPLLPLGQGTLTLNSAGIPIVVVCTKADLMDSAAEEIGMKGGGWEERTDWIQQVLRTICLAYGAALFYTAPTQPTTYTLLRSYLLHRLHTVSPPLSPPSSPSESTPSSQASSSRFPFPHRANVLDRDAVMVPTGWDSWGKINVLREGFEPARVGKAWEVSLRRAREPEEEDDDGEEGLEDLWVAMIPDTGKDPKSSNHQTITTKTEPEQTFLARQLDILQKDPNRDPRAAFRTAAAAVRADANSQQSTADPGIVGPMGMGGLNLPGVEKAMADMEGGGGTEDLRDKFAKLGRRESATPGASATGTTQNEALHNFFHSLIANKGKTTKTDAK